MNATRPGLMIALLLCAAPAGAAETQKPNEQQRAQGTRITVEKQSLSFDPRTVMRGQAGFGWGLGSVGVAILGREDGFCIFNYTDEVEGGYTIYRCRVPLDKPVRIYEDNGGIVTSFPLDEAKLIGGGNILLPRDDPPGPQFKMPQRGVPETGYVNYQGDAIIGPGAAAEKGKRVTIRYRLFADRTFTTAFVGVARSHDLTFTIGESDTGPGVEVAVLGMKERGRRFAVIREEAAKHFVKQLGGVQPGTQLGVEVELLGVDDESP